MASVVRGPGNTPITLPYGTAHRHRHPCYSEPKAAQRLRLPETAGQSPQHQAHANQPEQDHEHLVTLCVVQSCDGWCWLPQRFRPRFNVSCPRSCGPRFVNTQGTKNKRAFPDEHDPSSPYPAPPRRRVRWGRHSLPTTIFCSRVFIMRHESAAVNKKDCHLRTRAEVEADDGGQDAFPLRQVQRILQPGIDNELQDQLDAQTQHG